MSRKYIEFIDKGKSTPSNSYWKEVLNEIYNRVPGAYGPGKFKEEEKNPIAMKLKISDWELYKNCMYLNHIGLIEYKNEGNVTFMYPTSKGLDVALQNEKIESDKKIKIATISLTAIIALTGAFSFLLTTGEYPSGDIVTIYIIGITAIYLLPQLSDFKRYISRIISRNKK
jgi:hypothetical protein